MTRCVANRNAMFGGANRDRRALRSSRRFSCRCRVRARSCSTVRTALRARRILGLLRIEAEYWFAPGIGAGLCCLRFRTLSLGGNVARKCFVEVPRLVLVPGSPLGGGRLRGFRGYLIDGSCPRFTASVSAERRSGSSGGARRSSARGGGAGGAVPWLAGPSRSCSTKL